MNNTYASRQIKIIEFDLSSSCNASCPSCSRYVVKNGETYLNEFINYNKNISLEIISDIFSSEYVDSEVHCDFVGSIGDPLANPKILDIVKKIQDLKPQAKILIHTNGGLRNPDLYRDLSVLIKKRGSIWFSIDGLEDTNHIYRKGVIWNRVMENLKACISGGSKVYWQFIEFPWNSHQVNEVKELAGSLGAEFYLRKNRLETEHQKFYFDAYDKGFHPKTKVKDDRPLAKIKRHAYGTIEPDCFKDQRMYINSDAQIMPCCAISTSKNTTQYRENYFEFVEEFGDNWNSLHHNNFNSIAESDYWDKLYDSVQDGATCTMTNCVIKCAKYLG